MTPQHLDLVAQVALMACSAATPLPEQIVLTCMGPGLSWHLADINTTGDTLQLYAASVSLSPLDASSSLALAHSDLDLPWVVPSCLGLS